MVDKPYFVLYTNNMIKREREKTMIDYITAHNGGIQMYAGVGNLKGWSKTAKGIAYTLKTCGINETVMGSSSMDFASEEGFETDDGAMLLWNEAIEIYNWEVHGVAG